MPITFDALSNSSAATPTANSVTFAATLAPTADFLVVTAFCRDALILSVTWNGVNMSLARTDNASNGLAASVWYLAAPATGTHNVVINTGVAPSYIAGAAISLRGVQQATPIDSSAAVETNGADPVFSGFTTIAPGCVVVDAVATNSTTGIVMNPGTNRVERANFFSTGSSNRGVGASTILPKTPAGAITMGWNIAANSSAYAGAAFLPAASPGGGGGTLSTAFNGEIQSMGAIVSHSAVMDSSMGQG